MEFILGGILAGMLMYCFFVALPDTVKRACEIIREIIDDYKSGRD